MMGGKRVAIAFILVLLITQSYGQKFSFGSCPTVTSAAVMIDMIEGTWREYARTPSVHTHNWQCVVYTITLVTTQVYFSLSVTGQNKITQQSFTVTGSITPGGTVADASTSGGTFLTIQFPSYYSSKSANYYILDGTDGVFLVLYSCENVFLGKIESVIILTSNTATPANIQTALTAVANVGYPLHALRRGYQGCIG
ncbi:uncharacterized protein LOC124168269 [Ischnura elegans]|uniref:uncharacterized protein LOC124168269 n=1 Tax=Ischnura elegans TaxID=197161 RepID=UPI001ED86CB6|nr:uncharacterized protein LOC124168269 [Ischnura elegans]